MTLGHNLMLYLSGDHAECYIQCKLSFTKFKRLYGVMHMEPLETIAILGIFILCIVNLKNS